MQSLYNGDCLKIMKEFPDKTIDMILCDLPYGITHCKWDKQIDLESMWIEYERIIKDNGVICLFAQTKFFYELIKSNYKLYRYDLIWDKVLTTGFLNANRQPLRRHEQIAIFYKKQPKYNPQMGKGPPLHGKGNIKTEKLKKNNVYGNFYKIPDLRKGSIEKYPTSILQFQRLHPSQMIYPTEKPVELLEYLIKTYTNKGDIVLDNCMGSGSTGKACKNTNRDFIGIEINPKTFEIAKNRLGG
ncbi:MAG: site-specific DNA-methyltransferase [Clostridia bacterium]|nr:site-specific DNA-methyltransferase [Clostridia bacterium]